MNLQQLISYTENMHDKNQEYFSRINGIIFFNEDDMQTADINEYKKQTLVYNNFTTENNTEETLMSFDENNPFSKSKYIIGEQYENIEDCIFSCSMLKFFPKQKIDFNTIVQRYNLNVIITTNKTYKTHMTETYNPLICIYEHSKKYHLMSNYLNVDVFIPTDIEHSFMNISEVNDKDPEQQKDFTKMSSKDIQKECEMVNIDLYHMKNGKKKKMTKKELIEKLTEYYN